MRPDQTTITDERLPFPDPARGAHLVLNLDLVILPTGHATWHLGLKTADGDDDLLTLHSFHAPPFSGPSSIADALRRYLYDWMQGALEADRDPELALSQVAVKVTEGLRADLER